MQKVSPIRAVAWTTVLAALLLANAVSPRVAGADPAASPAPDASASSTPPASAAPASAAPSSAATARATDDAIVTNDVAPGTSVVDASRTTPSPSPSPSPSDTPDAGLDAIYSPAPSPTPRAKATPKPWLFGPRPTLSPLPKTLATIAPEPKVKAKATPLATPVPSPVATKKPQKKKHATLKGGETNPARAKSVTFPIPAPLPAITAQPIPRPATPRPTRRPTPAPTVEPTPVATPTPEPEATATPTPTAPPTAPPKRSSSTRRATPSPTPSLAPAPEMTAESVSPTEPPPGVETPIPTQPPTPRPLAPNQPTIPESMSDPNVQGIMTRPIRQLSQIGWMTGTWHATGTQEFANGTTRPLVPTTWVFAPVLDNRWMFGADGRSMDYFYMTFDPFARHWVALRFANNPAYGVWTSEKGWVGNRIDFVTNFSYVNGRQYRRRLTIIHKDPHTFGIYETEQLPDGNWAPDDAVEFSKT